MYQQREPGAAGAWGWVSLEGGVKRTGDIWEMKAPWEMKAFLLSLLTELLFLPGLVLADHRVFLVGRDLQGSLSQTLK